MIRILSKRRVMTIATALAVLPIGGCATAWKPSGSFYRTEQTRLVLNSTPPAQATVNGKIIGTTPATIALQYGREVAMKSRKNAYYRSEPGWALFLTAITFGFYFPCGCIPLDVQTEFEPLGNFKENAFTVELTAPEYEPWKQQVVCTGEKMQNSIAILSKK